MTLNFYNNNEDAVVFPKTTNRDNLTFTATGKLKDDTTMEHPVFILEYDPDIKNSNYVHSDDFARYYFILNVTFSQQRMFVECEEDYLNSFADDILELEAYVSRMSINQTGGGTSSESYVPNILLPDDYVPVQVNRIIRVTGQGDTTMNNFGSIDGGEADPGAWIMLINGGRPAS